MPAVIAYLFSISLALLSTTWHLQSFTCLLVYSDLRLPPFLPLSPPQPPSLTSACIPVMGYCFSNLADRGTIFMYCFSIFISHAHMGPLVCHTHAHHRLSMNFIYFPLWLLQQKLLLLYIYFFFFLRGQMRARK